MLENLIAYHCGPALAGIKPSNIASCRKSRMPDIHSEIDRLNSELNSKDIYIEILCECDKRVLVMVYRKKVLEKHLKKPEMIRFLNDYGYPADSSVREYIDFLIERLAKNEFPHEIGIFLGYPLQDIYGFIYHKGKGGIFIGEWKVYSDADGARKLFSRYNACRKAIVKRLEGGQTLAGIFCAA